MTDSERLIQEFCALIQLNDPQAIGRGAPLDVAGITCSLTLARHDEANALVVYCEFGAVPSGREVAIYQELLVQNYIGAPDCGVFFGFSPVSKNMICIQHLRVKDMTAQRVVDVLNHLADKAVEWRKTYFLKPAEGIGQREAIAMPSSARRLLGGSRQLSANKDRR